MIGHKSTPGLIVKYLLAGVILLHFPSILEGQTFVEEALDRGINAVISSPSLGGAGVSAIDFDNDGDDDLTLGDSNGVHFYLNENGSFTEIDPGIETPPGNLRGLIWADINNDGHLDLMMSSYLGNFRLYRNNGELNLEDITESCGISTDFAGNWGISFVDYNRDGYLDVQLCRYVDWFTIPDNPEIEPERWTRLYMNNGNDTFTDVTQASGLVIEPAPVFLGVFLDFNNDLWPDNFSIIDRFPGNRLFLNTEGQFSDVTAEYGVSFPENDIMSNSVADYDNDGDLDIYMTNNGGVDNPTILMENNDGQSFQNVAPDLGVELFEFSWAAVWIDANNNGWQDLYVCTRYDDPNYFFFNNEGSFTAAEDEIDSAIDVPSFSAAKGDFDNDGFYDLMVHSRSPHRSILLMNQGTENHYLKLTPHGTISNSMAVGSWIKLYTNGDEYVHFTLCGEAYISQHSQHLIFGLGEETSVDSLKIQYPSGHEDIYYELQADTAYHFHEGETYQIAISPMNAAICQGGEIVLDAGDHSSYLWNNRDTTRFTTADSAGIYSVTVVNDYGIIASDQIEVEIYPNPIISKNIIPNPCSGDSTASITLQNLTGIEADSVIWDNGMTGVTIDSLANGVYEYLFTDLNGCTQSGTASVIDPPELFVWAESDPETLNQSNGVISVVVFGGVPPYTILLEGDTVELPIENLTSGVYSLTVIDGYGCTEEIEVSVENILGVRSELSQSAVAYPNPTNGPLKIESVLQLKRVSVFDARGGLALEIVPEESSINLESLPNGLYFLKATFENMETGHFKVIKN